MLNLGYVWSFKNTCKIIQGSVTNLEKVFIYLFIYFVVIILGRWDGGFGWISVKWNNKTRKQS